MTLWPLLAQIIIGAAWSVTLCLFMTTNNEALHSTPHVGSSGAGVAPFASGHRIGMFCCRSLKDYIPLYIFIWKCYVLLHIFIWILFACLSSAFFYLLIHSLIERSICIRGPSLSLLLCILFGISFISNLYIVFNTCFVFNIYIYMPNLSVHAIGLMRHLCATVFSIIFLHSTID